MNQNKYLNRLARQARLETPPSVDVTARVMARVRAEATDDLSTRPLLWLTACSAAAAVAIAVLAMETWGVLSNPILELAYGLTWGMI